MIHPAIDPAREALVRQVDGVADRPAEARRVCSKCRRAKPPDEFPRRPGIGDGLDRRCRACKRIADHVRYHEGGGREKKAAYGARDEVKARRRQAALDHPDRHSANDRTYLATPRGRLVHDRAVAVVRLRDATGDARRRRLRARIALADLEIARLDGDCDEGRRTT